MIYEEMGYDSKDLGDSIVDSPSSGLTLCPKCKTNSVNERGWCYNGHQVNSEKEV